MVKKTRYRGQGKGEGEGVGEGYNVAVENQLLLEMPNFRRRTPVSTTLSYRHIRYLLINLFYLTNLVHYQFEDFYSNLQQNLNLNKLY